MLQIIGAIALGYLAGNKKAQDTLNTAVSGVIDAVVKGLEVDDSKQRAKEFASDIQEQQ